MTAVDPENYQRRSTVQFNTFKDMVRTLLAERGFKLLGKKRFPNGVEVHDIAVNALGEQWYLRYCGSWVGDRPGLKRSDTVKKFLHNAYSLHADGDRTPYVVITNQVPKPGSASDRFLKDAERHGVLHKVFNIDDSKDERKLKNWADGLGEDDDGE